MKLKRLWPVAHPRLVSRSSFDSAALSFDPSKVKLGRPSAIPATRGTPALNIGIMQWHVTLGAKWQPNATSPTTSPELNRNMNPNILRVLFLEPIQILFYLLVIKLLTFKLRLKSAYLSMKVRYLAFKVGKLVSSKRKILFEYRRRSMLGDQLLNGGERVHKISSANVRAMARRGKARI